MVCPPPWWCVCRDHAQDPVSFPDTSEVAVGFLVFCILLFIICPNCACTLVFLVPYSFFVSVAQGDICPGASTAAKGPRSQVPACLSFSTREDPTSTRSNTSVHSVVGGQWVFIVHVEKVMDQEAGEFHSHPGSATEELCHPWLE